MEFKIDATLYIEAKEGESIEELIDRLYMLIDSDVGIQLYKDIQRAYRKIHHLWSNNRKT